MAEDVGVLVARLVADTEGLRTEMEKARKTIDSQVGRVNRRLSTMDKRTNALTSSFGTWGRAIGIVGGTAVLGRLIRGVKDAGVEMEALDRRMKTATGSAEAGEKAFGFVRDEAERLGLDVQAAATGFSSLAAAAEGTALQGQSVRDIFTSVAEASRVLNLDAANTEGVLRAIEQIISKGTVSAEELRGQLGERLPGAFQIAARSIGVTTGELDKMLRLGQVTAEELLPKLAEEMRKTFGPEVEEASKDAQASFNRLSNSIFELKASIAESGILDVLADISDIATAAVRGFSTEFLGTLPKSFEGLTARLDELRDRLDATFDKGSPYAQSLLAELQAVELAILKATEAADAAVAPSQDLSQLQKIEVEPHRTFGGLHDQLGLDNLPTIAEENLAIVESFEKSLIRSAERTAEAYARTRELMAESDQILADLQKEHADNNLDDVKLGLQAAAGALAVLGRHSKSAFKLSKLAAIATSTINTYEAVTKALTLPFPANFAVAAAVAAAGFAQVAAIRSQSFSGGGGGARGISGASASLATTPPSTQAAAESLGQKSSVQIIFQGDVNGWDDFVENRVIESIKTAVDEKDVILIGAESRNASEIAETVRTS